jgi:uncharacterized protein
MSLKVSTVMIGVEDLERSKRFYAEGLGCRIAQDHPGFVNFDLGEGSSTLALYRWEAAAKDAGVSSEGSGFRGVSLHFIVSSSDEVEEVMRKAAEAGAGIVREATTTQWGSFGYFSDPDGHLWKVASS